MMKCAASLSDCMTRVPEFSDGSDAIEQLEQNLAHYTLVYTAEFNTKLIGALWCTGRGKQNLGIYCSTSS